MTKPTTEMLKTAEELGVKAFDAGIAAPVLDAAMMALLQGFAVGESVPALKAWNRGWTKAQLAVPFEER